MAALHTELFLWTTQQNTVTSAAPTGLHRYHEKDPDLRDRTTSPYHEERQLYDENRDLSWVLRNKRPEKLRDSLKEVEDLLQAHKFVHYRWRTRRLIQTLLSNGYLISFVLSSHSGDLDRIFIDKTLSGKLCSDKICDAIVTDIFIACTHADCAKLDYIYLTKKLPSGDGIKKLEKLGTYEPKFSVLDLPGPQTTRRLDRKLCLGVNEDLILSWWTSSGQEAWPWTPMTSERERANCILIGVTGTKVDILSYIRTESDPVSVSFSQIHQNLIHMVEKVVASANNYPVEVSTYEIIKGKIQRQNEVAFIPLKSPLSTCARNPSEDRLLITTDNGHLVLYDEQKKVTQTEQITVPPHHVSWHPDGTFIFICSNRGDIQILDLALCTIQISLQNEEYNPVNTLRLAQYFRTPPLLYKLSWCDREMVASDYMSDSADSLLLIFDKGPLAVFQFSLGVFNPNRLSPIQMINEYIKQSKLAEAVSLLCSLNWNTDPAICYQALMNIMVHLLRLPLNVHRQTQLEYTLGTFYAPTRPLSEAIVLEYRDPISRLARRFVHHLLRYSRFDKAFLLAVDIGQRDLFMDIYHLAKDKGENVLSEVAKRKADQIRAEHQNSSETESESSYGEDSLSHDSESGSGSSPSRQPHQYYETDLDEPFNLPNSDKRV